MAICTSKQLVDKALSYVGYMEKNSPNADLNDFKSNAGSGNYQKFEPLVTGGNGSYWCQYFIDGIAIEACGNKDDAKTLMLQTGMKYMTGYTPTASQCFKNAGRYFKKPLFGDIAFFYTQSKGRISHVGIVVFVDENNKTFTTVEGNTNSDGFTTNGGCVAKHTYGYSNVGGGNRVDGFGRPMYADSNNYSFSPAPVHLGSNGPSVVLLQSILKARGFLGADGLPLKLDGDCQGNTVFAINEYQKVRMNVIDLGTNGSPDGWCGNKMWSDILGF